jgi:sulfite exporter TauE/SafE
MESQTSLYSALLLSGLLGSLGHCLGMCGPLVMMLGVRLRSTGQTGVLHQLVYHGSRIAVYAGLGAVAGGIGSLLGIGSQLRGPAGVISLCLGSGVIIFGLGYLGWLPIGCLEGAGSWLNRAMGWGFKQAGFRRVMTLGALNGFLPCGLVYSALLVAGSSGAPLPGALGMLLFGASTIPALLVVGLGAGALGVRVRQGLARVAGGLIVAVGIQLLLRGAAALGVVAHLRLGTVALW